MSEELGPLELTLKGRDLSLRQTLEAAEDKLEHMDGTITKIGANTGLLALEKTFDIISRGVQYMLDTFNETLPQLDSMAKASMKFQTDTEWFTGLAAVAKENGIEFGELNNHFTKMEATLGKALNGGTAAIKTFDSLGLSVEKLSKMSTQSQFEVIIDTISKLPTLGEKMAAISGVFGKNSGNMANFVELGVDGINDLIQEADRLGATFDEMDAKLIMAAESARDHFNQALEGMKQEATIGLAESIGDINERLADYFALLNETGASRESAEALGSIFTTIADSIGYLHDKWLAAKQTLLEIWKWEREMSASVDILGASSPEEYQAYIDSIQRQIDMIQDLRDGKSPEGSGGAGSELPDAKAEPAKMISVWDEVTHTFIQVEEGSKEAEKAIKAAERAHAKFNETASGLSAADLHDVKNAYAEMFAGDELRAEKLKELDKKKKEAEEDLARASERRMENEQKVPTYKDTSFSAVLAGTVEGYKAEHETGKGDTAAMQQLEKTKELVETEKKAAEDLQAIKDELKTHNTKLDAFLPDATFDASGIA